MITALVSSGGDEGISYSIGALYGAGLFVCSMVVALCILNSEDVIEFDPMIIYRDIGFYLLATFSTLLFAVL